MILVIGLGGIGGNMALRLIEEGMAVAGLDRDSERTRAWEAESGRLAFTGAEEVPWNDVSQVVIAVRTEGQMNDVLAELPHRLGDRPTGVAVVSTISVGRAACLQEELPASWRVMEAPVSGGEAAARRGSLTMFTHASQRTVEDDQLVAALSDNEYQFDEPGQATFVKLLNNTVAAYNARGTALAMAIGASANVSGDVLLDAIGNSSGASFAGAHLLQLSDNQLELLHKDVALLGLESASLALVDLLDGWRADLARVRSGRVAGDAAL